MEYLITALISRNGREEIGFSAAELDDNYYK